MIGGGLSGSKAGILRINPLNVMLPFIVSPFDRWLAALAFASIGAFRLEDEMSIPIEHAATAFGGRPKAESGHRFRQFVLRERRPDIQAGKARGAQHAADFGEDRSDRPAIEMMPQNAAAHHEIDFPKGQARSVSISPRQRN